MNLLCLSDFNEGGMYAKAGDVHWFPLGVALHMVDSWPACWAVAPIVTVEEAVEPETEAIDAPPADKMMRKAKAKRRG